MGEYEEIKGKRQNLYTQIRELGGKRKAEKEGTPAFAKLTSEMDALRAEASKMREPYEKAFAAQFGCKPTSLKTAMRLSPSHLPFKVDDEAMAMFWGRANRLLRKEWARVSDRLKATGAKAVTKKEMAAIIRVNVTPEERENRKMAEKARKAREKADELEKKAKQHGVKI